MKAMRHHPPLPRPTAGKSLVIVYIILFIAQCLAPAVSKPILSQDEEQPLSASTDAELCARKNSENSWTKVVTACDKAIQSNPRLAQLWVDRCHAKLNLGRLVDANADCQEALRLDPFNALGLVRRGNIHQKLRYYADAFSDYNKAIRLDPSNVPAFGNRGLLRLGTKDYRGAIVDFNKVIQLEPSNVRGYVNRAYANEQLDNFSRALADYTVAIALDPKNVNHRYNRALMHASLSEYRAALADLDHVIAGSPQWNAPYNERGNVKGVLKDYRSAIADYDQAIALSENEEAGIPLSNRARAKQWSGDYQGALLDAQLAIEHDPIRAILHVEYGEILFLQGRRKEACASFRRGSSIGPIDRLIKYDLPPLNQEYLHTCYPTE
jgi:tetratricopeptide (TPR) repeat protein